MLLAPPDDDGPAKGFLAHVARRGLGLLHPQGRGDHISHVIRLETLCLPSVLDSVPQRACPLLGLSHCLAPQGKGLLPGQQLERPRVLARFSQEAVNQHHDPVELILVLTPPQRAHRRRVQQTIIKQPEHERLILRATGLEQHPFLQQLSLARHEVVESIGATAAYDHHGVLDAADPAVHARILQRLIHAVRGNLGQDHDGLECLQARRGGKGRGCMRVSRKVMCVSSHFIPISHIYTEHATPLKKELTS